MEKHNSMGGALFALGAAVAGALAFGLYLIGPSTLQTVAIILGVSIGLALVIVASAVLVRAYRKSDAQPTIVERHYIHDGTRTVERHTLDGRTVEAPKLLQLPAVQQEAFPALLRAAYQAGQARADERAIDVQYRELPEVDPSRPEEWGGELRP